MVTMSVGSYVMITPARNEETAIETTIQSVLAQTHRPKEWVIVSDRSTDQTDQILSRYAGLHSFIHPVRVPGQGGRSFASAVRAIEAGVNALQSHDYNFLSLSDADVRFQADYFERLIGEFNRDPLLGLAGGLVCDGGDENPRWSQQNLAEVAGAAQFFRRECFQSLGGLVAIPEG